MSIAFLNKYWTSLFFSRHVDQIILCCFYRVAKISKVNLTFREIVCSYRRQPQVAMVSLLVNFVVAATQPCGVRAQRFAVMHTNLTANAEALEEATKELEARKRDIKRGIMDAKLKDELNVVKDWIKHVEKIIVNADIAVEEARANRRKYVWRCYNARSHKFAGQCEPPVGEGAV